MVGSLPLQPISPSPFIVAGSSPHFLHPRPTLSSLIGNVLPQRGSSKFWVKYLVGDPDSYIQSQLPEGPKPSAHFKIDDPNQHDTALLPTPKTISPNSGASFYESFWGHLSTTISVPLLTPSFLSLPLEILER